MERFDALPIFGVYLGIVILLLLFFETGFQISRRIKLRADTNASVTVGPMVGGMLAMLAFVLALTFSMVASQNNLRKQSVLEETNAIGTAYMRADLLAVQHRSEIKRLLKEYVDIRLEAVLSNEEIITKEAIERSVVIHRLLWDEVSAAAATASGPNTILAVNAINGVIDVHEKRVAAGLYNRIPVVIWLALLVISGLTMITMGVQAGFSRLRILVAVVPLLLAFSALTILVVDLDRPYGRLIKVEQASMVHLQSSMEQDMK
jgi:uncharacterized membrane protein (DUF485 family)